MVYSKDDFLAPLAMERERTGGYGELYRGDLYGGSGIDEGICPVCGEFAPQYFYLDGDDECVGCSECVHPSAVLF